MIQFLISGTTLVWVAILVIIVVYNFALTAFALFRSTLDPYGELPFFGYNLFQTFIVILRYGIIGELYEVKRTQCISLFRSSILFGTEHVQGRFKAILMVYSRWLEPRQGHLVTGTRNGPYCPPLFWSQFRRVFLLRFLSVWITI